MIPTTHELIAYCKCGCGNLIFFSVDIPGDVQTAKDVREMIADEYTVTRVDWGTAKALLQTTEWGCKNKPVQEALI